jgi:hypothetical protein
MEYRALENNRLVHIYEAIVPHTTNISNDNTQQRNSCLKRERERPVNCITKALLRSGSNFPRSSVLQPFTLNFP